jgi:hypothetical protein
LDASLDSAPAPKPVVLSPAEYRKRGQAALARHDFYGAHVAFEGAISQNQNDPDALCGNADTYLAEGRAKSSRGAFMSAQKFYIFCKGARPHYLRAHLGFADAGWENGDRAIAKAAYQEIVDLFPEETLPERVTERASK